MILTCKSSSGLVPPDNSVPAEGSHYKQQLRAFSSHQQTLGNQLSYIHTNNDHNHIPNPLARLSSSSQPQHTFRTTVDECGRYETPSQTLPGPQILQCTTSRRNITHSPMTHSKIRFIF